MNLPTARLLKATIQHGLSSDDVLDVTGMKNRLDLESYEDVDVIAKALEEGVSDELIRQRIGHLAYRRRGGKLDMSDWASTGEPEKD